MTQSKFLGIFEGTQPKLSINYCEIYLIGDFNINLFKNGKYVFDKSSINNKNEKQPPRGVPRKSVLKIRSIFTGEHPWRSVISTTLLCNFIEITLRHGCSLNLQHIFRATFLKNTYGWLLLKNLDSFTKWPCSS